MDRARGHGLVLSLLGLVRRVPRRALLEKVCARHHVRQMVAILRNDLALVERINEPKLLKRRVH